MKMSTRGRYGLRLMVTLAEKYGQGPVSAEVISRHQDISASYIHLLITGLRSKGLVRAVRGPGGGYTLAKHPRSITALDVVAALEGKSAPVNCVSKASACPRSRQCVARDVWCEVAAAVDGVLADLSLAKLAVKRKTKTRTQEKRAS